jgi:hypothetical protein
MQRRSLARALPDHFAAPDGTSPILDRRFTTLAGTDDDLRRAPLDASVAWGDVATRNGVPLPVPLYSARHLAADASATTQRTRWAGKAPTKPAPAAPAVVTREKWPWWIWPLAAAAAVAVRGA